jgi:hypothetical protein
MVGMPTPPSSLSVDVDGLSMLVALLGRGEGRRRRYETKSPAITPGLCRKYMPKVS